MTCKGHARTALIDRPLSIEQMADDIAALMQQLGVERADIAGYAHYNSIDTPLLAPIITSFLDAPLLKECYPDDLGRGYGFVLDNFDKLKHN